MPTLPFYPLSLLSPIAVQEGSSQLISNVIKPLSASNFGSVGDREVTKWKILEANTKSKLKLTRTSVQFGPLSPWIQIINIFSSNDGKFLPFL